MIVFALLAALCSAGYAKAGNNSGVCQGGYEPHYIIGPINATVCIKVYDERKSWVGAAFTCIKEKGTLYTAGSINEAFKNSILEKLQRGKRYWTAAIKVDGSFVNAFGVQPLDNQLWAKNEPNNFRGKEECVEMMESKKGSWNDQNCCKKRPFICQRMSGDTF